MSLAFGYLVPSLWHCWGKFRRYDLMKELCQWGQPLLVVYSLCFLLAVQDVSFQKLKRWLSG